MKKLILILLVSVVVQSCKKFSPAPTPKTVITKALTQPQIDTLVKNFSGVVFHDVADSTKTDGNQYTVWTSATLASYPASIHYVHTVTSTANGIISGTYQEIYNSNNVINVNATFSISADGKVMTVYNSANNRTATVEIVTLTSTEFDYIVFNYTKGVDYKFVGKKY